MKRYALLALLCCGAVALGDDMPSQVPEIPFDSVPNFLKLPPDLYLGEVSGVAVNSKKHIFVYSRGGSGGPAYGSTASQLLEFGPTANTSARSARTCMPGRTRTPCGSTRTTTSGPSTKGRT